jgi:hypothetical protein
MKKSILAVLLAAGSMPSIAQTTGMNQLGIPSDFIFRRNFTIELKNSNKVTVELADINDLSRLLNLDSLIQKAYEDIQQLADTTSDPLSAVRFDHSCLEDGLTKIRSRKTTPTDSYYIKLKQETALLKTLQDSLVIAGIIKHPAAPLEHKLNPDYPRYYRLTVSINRISDIPEILNGELNGKMNTLLQEHSGKWKQLAASENYALEDDPSITAAVKRGHTIKSNDQLELNAGVLLQNYQGYFTPAFNLKATLVLINKYRNREHAIGIAWQPTFAYTKNPDGKLSGFRNDFIEFSYKAWRLKNGERLENNGLNWNFSVGYLLKERGSIYTPSTFRIGLGGYQYRKSNLEAGLYFSDFFKKPTPTIRLSHTF